MKIKVLIVSDSPYLDTGMGIVHRNIGQQLYNRGFEIVSLGWSNEQSPNVTIPWYVYKTKQTDYYGQQIFDSVVQNEHPDIVLTIGDVWTISYIATASYTRALYKWVGYTAVDGEAYGGGVPTSWLQTLRDMDKVVAYTKYGKNALEKSMPEARGQISIIPHGVDTKVYHPIDHETRMDLRKKYGILDSSIVYLIVARNQFRKNIPEILKAWKAFRDKGYRNAFLWPHMVFNDPCGWNLDEVINMLGIKNTIYYLEQFAYSGTNLDTISKEEMNTLYNLCDVVLMVSGEGFGLPILEAMACGKPVIGLNHSACIELLEGRGELVNVGNYMTGVKNTERPLPDLNHLVNKLELLYTEHTLRSKYGQLGLDYAKGLTWDYVGEVWAEYLTSAMNPFVTGKCVLEQLC